MLVTALFIGMPSPVFAAGERAYLAPASGITQPGYSFIVSVDGYVGNAGSYGHNTVNGSINFPAHLLQVTSISSAGSTFPTSTVTPNNTTGKITFNQNANWWNGVNDQNIHMFTITFKATANGNANVSFGTVQYFAGWQGNLSGTAATTGGTYTISTPAPPPSPSPSPTPVPSTTPKPTPKPSVKPTVLPSPVPTPAPVAEVTPAPVIESDGGLKIENVKINTTRQKNSLSWSLNKPEAIPTVTYGLSKNALKSEASATKKEDGSYQVEFESLKPGTLYYFTVKASTADNLQGATYSGTLTTRGYPVQLTVQQNGLLAPAAKVAIGSRSFTANKNAVITAELSEGKFNALITPEGSTKSYPVSFTVAKKQIPANGDPQLQSFTLNAVVSGSASTTRNDNTMLFMIGGIAAGVIGFGALIGFLLYRKRQNQLTEGGSSVDEDLLVANYGDAINSYRTNTPAPNLEATSNLSPASLSPQDTSAPLTELPQTETLAPQGAPEQQTAQALTETQFDPSALPLPPTPDATLPEASTPMINDSTGYSEEEQITPELAQIESEQIPEEASDEPSAVYDAATGELDIIHHRDIIASPVAPQPTEQLNSTDSPEMVSDVPSIEQPPSPSSSTITAPTQ